MFLKAGIGSNTCGIMELIFKFLIYKCAGKEDLLTTTVEEDSSSSNKIGPHGNKYSISLVRCFGVDLTPDNIAIALVYFVQGILGLSDLAVSFYLKDNLHLDPAEVCHPHLEYFVTLLVELPQYNKRIFSR